MEAIIDEAVADGTKIDAILAENDSTALGVVGALTGKNYGYPPAQRSGRRHRQPEQRGPRQAVRRRLEERQRAGQDRRAPQRSRCATAARWPASTLPDGLIDPNVAPVAGLTRAAVHDAGWQHGQLVHPAADPAHGRTTCSWSSTVARSPRTSCARASTPPRRRRPASSGLLPSEASTCAPGSPGGAGRSQRPGQEGRRGERGRCSTGSRSDPGRAAGAHLDARPARPDGDRSPSVRHARRPRRHPASRSTS